MSQSEEVCSIVLCFVGGQPCASVHLLLNLAERVERVHRRWALLVSIGSGGFVLPLHGLAVDFDTRTPLVRRVVGVCFMLANMLSVSLQLRSGARFSRVRLIEQESQGLCEETLRK